MEAPVGMTGEPLPHVRAGDRVPPELVQLVREYLIAHGRTHPGIAVTAVLANKAIDWRNATREDGPL